MTSSFYVVWFSQNFGQLKLRQAVLQEVVCVTTLSCLFYFSKFVLHLFILFYFIIFIKVSMFCLQELGLGVLGTWPIGPYLELRCFDTICRGRIK
jgi:hypothetical protein